MSLLDKWLDRQNKTPDSPVETLEQRQTRVVSEFESACRNLRDATRPHEQISPKQELWDVWYNKSQEVEASGIDPLDYANARRGNTRG